MIENAERHLREFLETLPKDKRQQNDEFVQDFLHGRDIDSVRSKDIFDWANNLGNEKRDPKLAFAARYSVSEFLHFYRNADIRQWKRDLDERYGVRRYPKRRVFSRGVKL